MITASRIRICIFAFIATEFDLSEIRTGAASSFAPDPPTIFYGVGEEIKEPRWIRKIEGWQASDDRSPKMRNSLMTGHNKSGGLCGSFYGNWSRRSSRRPALCRLQPINAIVFSLDWTRTVCNCMVLRTRFRHCKDVFVFITAED